MAKAARSIRKPAPPAPRPRREPAPNLPQHDLPEPFARLQTLGESTLDEPEAPIYAETADRIRKNDLRAGIAKLIAMAQDMTYYQYLGDEARGLYDTRTFARVHALRVLTALGADAQAAISPLLPLLDDEDDLVAEESVFFYGAMGEPAIEPLMTALLDADSDTFARASAASGLSEIADAHPKTRSQIVGLLEQALLLDPADEELNGYLIGYLLDLDARESLPLIQEAFAQERVDPFVIQMVDVEEHFGLPITTPRRNVFLNEDDELVYDIEDDEADDEASAFRLPTADGSPVSDSLPQTPYVAPVKAGRNDPCPCGSGKKFKKCCGS